MLELPMLHSEIYVCDNIRILDTRGEKWIQSWHVEICQCDMFAFSLWTPPPGPACRWGLWCYEACAGDPPENTHLALCPRRDSTPAVPGRWRSTASEEKKKGSNGGQRWSCSSLENYFPTQTWLFSKFSDRSGELSCQLHIQTGQGGSVLTSVWMSWQRCSRILLTKPNTSTRCSTCIMSIMLSITMNVPVLPTPALWKHKQEAGQNKVHPKRSAVSIVRYKLNTGKCQKAFFFLTKGVSEHLWKCFTVQAPPPNRFIRVILADFTSGRTEPEFHSWVPSINSGPHSRTTVPLPRHLLQQLLQSAADFFRQLCSLARLFPLTPDLPTMPSPSPTLGQEFYLQCTTMGPA